MPRDLRKIDSSNFPHMLVRPSAILLNLLHLRVLIKHDRVLLFDVYGSSSSSAQSEFMYELQGKLRQKQPPGTNNGLPYEFRALEVVLMSVTSELWKEFGAVQEPVMLLLSDLEDDVDREKLRILLVLSKKVSTFEQKARLVRDAIEELLEADDDLAQMYLTEKTRDIRREQDDHTEIEMLLESYHKICDEVVQEAGNLVSGIRNTEEMYVSQARCICVPNLPANNMLQYPCHSRRQPQLAHASRTAIQRLHARSRPRHFPRRALRHEPRELYRGNNLRLPTCIRRLCLLRRPRALVGPGQAAKGAARPHEAAREAAPQGRQR